MLPAAVYYDGLAPIYDSATRGKWNPNVVLAPFLKHVARPGIKALDIGCGTGQTIDLVYECLPEVDVTGIDISPGMIDICRRKHPSAQLLCGQLSDHLTSLPVPGFELVTCIGAFEFIADSMSFLQTVARVLNPDGLMFFTYEPVIKYHEIQCLEQSIVKPGDAATQAGVHSEGFCSYRFHPHFLERQLESVGLMKLLDIEFIAYHKQSVPITYHLLKCCLRQGR